MKVLVASLQVGHGASKGHLHPMVGLVQRLRGDGHDVAWLSVPHAMGEDDRAEARATGARLLDPPELPEGATATDLAKLASNPDRAWEAYRAFLLDPIDALVPALSRLLERERPDVVAADSLAYAAVIAAARARVPVATICAGLKLAAANSLATGYRFDLSRLEIPRRDAFARHGVDVRFHMLEALSPDLVVMFTTRDLLGDVSLPPNTLLAGPSRPIGARGDEISFPWERLDPTRPLVYAAFGSVHTREPLLDVVTPFARAANVLGLDLVIASEALAGTAHPHLLHALIVPYAPQRALLARAATFVTHGGANSVTEALDLGVPLVVVPLSGDQTIQARLVSGAGAGITMPRDGVNVSRCLDALAATVIGSSKHRARAGDIRSAWQACDGGTAAARAIARLGVRK